MKILLLTEVEKLGKAGDVVTVKDGYGRNFLIPAGMASIANPRSIKALEAQKATAIARQGREVKTFEGRANVLKQTTITIEVQVGEGDKMFGAVTSADISAKLAETAGLTIDKRIIVLPDPIKALGDHIVPVKLHASVDAHITVRVVKAE